MTEQIGTGFFYWTSDVRILEAIVEIEIIEVELKYCERCGGLWLRPCGSGRVFCAKCAPKMAAMGFSEESPEPIGLSFPVPVDDGDDGFDAVGDDDFTFLCMEGGNA